MKTKSNRSKQNEKMDIKLKKCITPKFRVSFPQVFKPKSFRGQEAKYSVVMLFDKSTDLTPLETACDNAIIEMYGDVDSVPKNFRRPFRKGSEREDTPGYENTIFVTANSKTQPGLIDRDKQPILNEQDFYAGCYARAELIAFCYDQMGNTGVSFSLQNIQKWADGAKFSGKRDAEDVFDSIEDGEDEESSYETDEESSSLGF